MESVHLEPETVLFGLIRNDVYEDSHDEIDEYYLDTTEGRVRHLYRMPVVRSALRDSDNYAERLEKKAENLNRRLREVMEEREEALLEVQPFYHGDFHQMVRDFIRQEWPEGSELREIAEDVYYKWSGPRSVHEWLQAMEFVSPYLRERLIRFEVDWMGRRIEHDLAQGGVSLVWNAPLEGVKVDYISGLLQQGHRLRQIIERG